MLVYFQAVKHEQHWILAGKSKRLTVSDSTEKCNIESEGQFINTGDECVVELWSQHTIALSPSTLPLVNHSVSHCHERTRATLSTVSVRV